MIGKLLLFLKCNYQIEVQMKKLILIELQEVKVKDFIINLN
jgi:hypothetical protein